MSTLHEGLSPSVKQDSSMTNGRIRSPIPDETEARLPSGSIADHLGAVLPQW